MDETAPDHERIRVANAGLPLDVVNALRGAELGVLWDTLHDNTRLSRIKQLVATLDLPESAAASRSRQVLLAYANRRFEADNMRLVRQLGWPADEFVPKPSAEFEGAEIGELDELWSSNATAAELRLLHAALRDAVDARS